MLGEFGNARFVLVLLFTIFFICPFLTHMLVLGLPELALPVIRQLHPFHTGFQSDYFPHVLELRQSYREIFLVWFFLFPTVFLVHRTYYSFVPSVFAMRTSLLRCIAIFCKVSPFTFAARIFVRAVGFRVSDLVTSLTSWNPWDERSRNWYSNPLNH